MKLLQRSSLWGAIGIILILILACMYLNTSNECKSLKNYNEVLCNTVNKQSIIISELENEKDNLKLHISQLEADNTKLEQENNKQQTSTSKTTSVSHNDFKSYMPYTAITSKASKQLKLQQQAYTDENGIRCIDDRPMIAVGTGWGVSVGDVVLITCENNNSFEAIIGDIKDNVDTNADNKTTSANNCRCEFIVDMSELDSDIKISGNVAVLKQYRGYVTNVQKID